MKTLFYFLCVFLSLQAALAQEVPLNGQIFINPYYYNPAFAGFEDRPAFYVYRRQQWTGISGAPVTTGFNFHTIFNNKVSFGAHIFNDERSILNTTKGLITVGYRASFDDFHYISFAITGGIGSNTIDFDAVDMDDPAIINALNTSLFLDGNAGFNYYNNGFNLGISLPKIFKSNAISYTSFSTGEISPLNDAILMSSYRWEILEDKFALEPHIIYYYTKELPGQYEVIGLMHFNNIFWVGASFRKDFGIAGFAGLNIKDNFKFGYAYELSTAQAGTFGYSTHDIQLALMIGKKKNKGKINLIQKRRNMLRAMGRMPQQRKSNTERIDKDPFTSPTSGAVAYDEKDALKDFLEEMEKDNTEEKTALDLFNEPVPDDTVSIFNFQFDEEVTPSQTKKDKRQEIIAPRFRKSRKTVARLEQPSAETLKEITFEDFSSSPDSAVFVQDKMLEEFLEDTDEAPYEEFSDPTHDESGNYIGPTTVIMGNHMLELEKGNYVIVGAFRTYREAEDYSDELFIDGMQTKFGFISQTKTYYVYVFMSEDFTESKTVSNRLTEMDTKYKENWILRVQ